MKALIKELEKVYKDNEALIKKFYGFFHKVLTNQAEATKEDREAIESLIKKLQEQLEAVRDDDVPRKQAITNTKKEIERIQTLIAEVSRKRTPQEEIAYIRYDRRLERLKSKLLRLRAVDVMGSVLPILTLEEVEEIQEALEGAVHDIYKLKLAREFISLMTDLAKVLIKLAVAAA